MKYLPATTLKVKKTSGFRWPFLAPKYLLLKFWDAFQYKSYWETAMGHLWSEDPQILEYFYYLLLPYIYYKRHYQIGMSGVPWVRTGTSTV